MSKFPLLLGSLAFGSFLAACSAAPVATTVPPPAKVGKTFPNAADAPVYAGTSFAAMQIFDLEAGLYLDEAALLEALDDDKLVFMGEQHETAPVQELELWLLTRMTTRHKDVSLGMEHFQADAQSIIDAYLSDAITSDVFEATAKPWKNYGIYWKPLVDHMKSVKRPVVGLNVPDDALSALYSAFPVYPLKTFNTWDASSPYDSYLPPRPVPLWDTTYKGYFESDFDYNAHGKSLGLTYAEALNYFTDLATIRDETMAYWTSQQLANAGGRVMVVAGDWHVQTGLATPDRAVRYAGNAPKTDLVTTTPAAKLAAMRAKDVSGRKAAHFAFVYQ